MPKPRIIVTGDSEQAVAFGLLQMLMQEGDAPRGRAAILAAFRECLEAVRGAGAPPARPLPPEEPPAEEEDEPAGEEDAAPHPPAPPRRRKPRRPG
ncbi:hypothetical protein [Teichococcus aestuarii]|uniref:Uncharacterized protein n=1 Tax=Teichococcus aestuarii TaxID=568898 RepID=A0A2U1V540_9PROT|nr:hypothetical protein [Pseudoroseomonas aestuarii]PWC28971.1 hypothetical protein CR165_10265 [Pseudoroseomonas aestuarii]